MTIRRSICAVAGILALSVASPVYASMACPTASVSFYESNYGAGTCMIGIFTVTNFSFISSGDTNLTDLQIQVIPSLTPQMVNLVFAGSNAFQVGVNQQASYTFRYTIDPQPPIIRGQEISLGEDPGFVVLTEDVCPDQNSCNGSPGGTQLLAMTGGPTSAQIIFNNLADHVSVHAVLNLQGDGTGTFIDGFRSSTLILATPEPSSYLLIGSGLLGLLACAGRAKFRKIFFQLRS